ncbi:pyridoxine 5'-phosphate synthase [Undibacterium sp. RuRC25W]|uniref:pyridoxine 5'-phosphate synthase n=1 Tax=Undibacterium sp. RuRC25W TaxID=3413047 RepID=UPI003BF40AA8
MNIHQQRQQVTLSVSLNAVREMREKLGNDLIDLRKLALFAEEAGADQISLSVQGATWSSIEADVQFLSRNSIGSFELEVAPADVMLDQVATLSVRQICLVSSSPMKGAVDVVDLVAQCLGADAAVKKLHACGKQVAAYVLPDVAQIAAAAQLGISAVRLNCSSLCEAKDDAQRARQLTQIASVATECVRRGLSVSVGGSLRLQDIALIAHLEDVVQVRVDDAVMAQALLCGWEVAVRATKALLVKSRLSAR